MAQTYYNTNDTTSKIMHNLREKENKLFLHDCVSKIKHTFATIIEGGQLNWHQYGALIYNKI